MKKILPIMVTLLSCIIVIFIFTLLSGSSVVNAETLESRINKALVLQINNPNAIYKNELKFVDSDNLAVCPFIKEDRTMVPLRFVSENLNAKVSWNQDTREVLIVKESGEKAVFIIGQKEFDIDGRKYTSDVAPELANDRTFVPIRVISEQLFNKEVFWNDGIIVISDTKSLFDTNSDEKLLDELYTKISQLPKVGSYENLLKLLANNNTYGNYRNKELNVTTGVPVADGATSEQTANDEKKEYSKTNTQVDGVDEADVVKTDGEFIYQVNNQKIVIIKAYPADSMKIVKEIKYPRDNNENFTPTEIYIDENYLVVIGNTYYYDNYPTPTDYIKATSAKRIMPPYYRSRNYTKAYIYDLDNYECEREIEVEGSYISSRKVDSNIYLITNKYVYTYYEINEDTDILPLYKDTAVSNETQKIQAQDIYYFPNFEQSSYLIVAGFDLDNMEKEVALSTYLGAGNEIYATSDTLYVTQQNYQYSILRDFASTIDVMPEQSQTTTNIYKFDISEGKISYKAKGEVPGTIINQFSMDENNGYFRIATTLGDTWNNTSVNNLYILDENLKITGKVEGLAKGERIYSTRFMGDRCYIVTYRNVDPLFVLDLSDTDAPKVLGQLKIPGYSEYLHPYDENHLIGIGKDTVVKVSENWNGENIETAYEVGMKMAMFDVTDVENPKELFSTKIGDRGSYSEALNNHKAFLFDKEKNIIAFPATVTVSQGVDYNGIPSYGKTEFQGALIFDVSLEKGFSLRGRISHSDIKADQYGNYNYDYYKQVERILYIDDVIYTLSKGMIKANNYDTLKLINSVTIEQNQEDYIVY